ncbi:hypothetical protein PHMEG_0004761 [Phytophthora megakarya]|uniref:PiggyBac transposable element-derived protein domain-containing protein n=1 Tax=Phytophthora megakarya TaxID=4795 RepID=A0A225WUP6_9STRA|nr:hypothetical protein PHMEG_0004761 [Phytophthora megakarya]
MTSQTTAAFHPADARPVGEGHKLEMDEEWVEVNAIRKRRRWQCKVFGINKTVSSKRQVTRFYCPSVYLCDKVRQYHYPNYNLTCYEIWHQLWRSERPQARCSRDIQSRGPKKRNGGIDKDDDAEEEPTHRADSAADTTSEIAEDTAARATEKTAASTEKTLRLRREKSLWLPTRTL